MTFFKTRKIVFSNKKDKLLEAVFFIMSTSWIISLKQLSENALLSFFQNLPNILIFSIVSDEDPIQKHVKQISDHLMNKTTPKNRHIICVINSLESDKQEILVFYQKIIYFCTKNDHKNKRTQSFFNALLNAIRIKFNIISILSKQINFSNIQRMKLMTNKKKKKNGTTFPFSQIKTVPFEVEMLNNKVSLLIHNTRNINQRYLLLSIINK
ncbi:hypothetical protein RFI_22637 [Reticulomyxa filosa]|uniref:Uncharacterized protein n=1 Tax=Reticulomyxa filosa TaxID=46433 RepID=X6MM47_RETFI|nr:hypothetical protein RFI_22637 [Reticulomyxa filosa]|eukprot:ETO14731.1 hypothetical protein RFI_22637 [Reticulomyxa filosa]